VTDVRRPRYPGWETLGRWEVVANLRARPTSRKDRGLWREFVDDREVEEALDELVGLLIEVGVIGRKRSA